MGFTGGVGATGAGVGGATGAVGVGAVGVGAGTGLLLPNATSTQPWNLSYVHGFLPHSPYCKRRHGQKDRQADVSQKDRRSWKSVRICSCPPLG